MDLSEESKTELAKVFAESVLGCEWAAEPSWRRAIFEKHVGTILSAANRLHDEERAGEEVRRFFELNTPINRVIWASVTDAHGKELTYRIDIHAMSIRGSNGVLCFGESRAGTASAVSFWLSHDSQKPVYVQPLDGSILRDKFGTALCTEVVSNI